MHLQKKRDLKQRICVLEADKAQLQEQMESASARCTEAEVLLKAAERELSAQERSNEQMRHHLQEAEKKASAATERAAALEFELSDTRVSGSCELD
jgi:chromosome segregation ATPase